MVTSPQAPARDHDRELERRVLNYLVGYKMPTLRSVQVHSDRGRVTLRGKVTSFYQRQLCIQCCLRVAGVRRLIDEIEVTQNN